MSTYDYYLIDFDGCMADTLSLWLDSYKKVFMEYGLIQSDEKIIEFCMGDNRGQEKLGISERDSVAFLNRVFELVANTMTSVQLNPNVSKTIKDLYINGKKIAIVTSSSKSLIYPILRKEKLHSFFETIVDKDDVRFHKPHPEPLEKALSILKGIKSKTIMIGDTINDLQAAKTFGISSCIFFPENNKRFYKLEYIESLNANYLITDFTSLLNL